MCKLCIVICLYGVKDPAKLVVTRFGKQHWDLCGIIWCVLDNGTKIPRWLERWRKMPIRVLVAHVCVMRHEQVKVVGPCLTRRRKTQQFALHEAPRVILCDAKHILSSHAQWCTNWLGSHTHDLAIFEPFQIIVKCFYKTQRDRHILTCIRKRVREHETNQSLVCSTRDQDGRRCSRALGYNGAKINGSIKWYAQRALSNDQRRLSVHVHRIKECVLCILCDTYKQQLAICTQTLPREQTLQRDLGTR